MLPYHAHQDLIQSILRPRLLLNPKSLSIDRNNMNEEIMQNTA